MQSPKFNIEDYGLTPDDIQGYAAILYTRVSSDPQEDNTSLDVASHYGQRLIAGAIQAFRSLGERGIKIDNIYATSRTPTGIKLCRKLKMKEEPVPGETRRLRFTLNAQTSDSPLIKGYQEAYSEYLRS
ncbi:MAG: hypothetical protein H0V70_05900 [Ktedonobacteraceae bacterium]|jgi:hypothetical protein|nr:hypothetical protein [Ktedonobacteraceae bacterium]